jgi:hypothetical protein
MNLLAHTFVQAIFGRLILALKALESKPVHHACGLCGHSPALRALAPAQPARIGYCPHFDYAQCKLCSGTFRSRGANDSRGSQSSKMLFKKDKSLLHVLSSPLGICQLSSALRSGKIFSVPANKSSTCPTFLDNYFLINPNTCS